MPAYSTIGPKFDLGQTLAGTDQNGTLINTEVLGQVYTFPAYTSTGSAVRTTRKLRYGGPLTVVALRNVSGVTIYGKRLVQLKSATAGFAGITGFNGYAGTSLAQSKVLPVDEFLGTAGCAANDICYCVLRGPSLGLTPYDGADFNLDIAAGAPVICAGTLGAGTTNGTTAGRLSNVTYWTSVTAAVTQNMEVGANRLGTAMSARTTGETNADLLVMWNIPLF